MTKYLNLYSNQQSGYKRRSVLPGLPAALISFLSNKRHSIGLLFILILCNISSTVEANDCTVTSESNSTTSRKIELNINCPDNPFFKLSEHSDSSDPSGVTIDIDSIDLGSEYADISISYPNGIQGGNGSPFEVPTANKELRILAVRFNFGDSELQPPSYATQAWAENMLFGEAVGFDGEATPNSLKKYVEQNSYGNMTVSGEVYPQWINLPSIETYRDINAYPTPRSKIYEDLIDQLVAKDPKFFTDKKFDFLVGLTPGGIVATTVSSYATRAYPWEGDTHGIFDGLLVLDIPIDSSSALYGTIENENRISDSQTMVIPSYNPVNVEGVWLATDLDHSGTNYYSGGRVTYDHLQSYDVKYIETGTPLPAANTEVVITYTPAVMERLSDDLVAASQPDSLISDRWFGFFVHELFHAAGRVINSPGIFLADLYQQPWENIREYGLMSTGNQPYLELGDFRYNIPAHLSGYSKMAVGYLKPYTLNYGENETSLRLYKTEEDDFYGTNERVKLIKVPLTYSEDSGVQQLVDYSGTSRRFFGKEYLLLEWRYKGELQANVRNFDAALPSEGLIIYHVIEGAPGLHGRDTDNIVRIIDATPAELPLASLRTLVSEEAFSLKRTPAAFGDDSTLYSYTADSPWNWKQADQTLADFILSPGSENKTIYANFMDLNGNFTTETLFNITLDDSGLDSTLPVISIAEPFAGDTLSGSVKVIPDSSSYFAIARVDLIVDGTKLDSTTLFPYDFYWQTESLNDGDHNLELRIYDSAGNSSSDTINIYVANQGDPVAEPPPITEPPPVNAPPAADAGADQIVTDNDVDGMETVALNGSASIDADGSITQFDWYENNVLIATGATPAIDLNVGSHSLTLQITDNEGAVAADDVLVSIQDSDIIKAPGNLNYKVQGTTITLSWQDNSANEEGFYIERGAKKKGTIVYSRINQTPENVVSFSENLSTGTYYYRLQAFNKTTGVISDYSNEVQLKIERTKGKK